MRGRDFKRPPDPGAATDQDRHRRKCAICHHPNREEIDEDYLRWCSPVEIVREYHLAHHSALYRHAHATGLAARRKQSVLTVLEYFMEHAQDAKPTANDVVNAVRLAAQMTGQWKEPEKKYIVVRQSGEDCGLGGEGLSDLSSRPASEAAAVTLHRPASSFQPSEPNRESGIRT